MANILILLIRFYKKYLSPFFTLVFGDACRFTPSCSEYTIIALGKYGTRKGLGLGIKRLLRCHPLGGFGYDPVN